VPGAQAIVGIGAHTGVSLASSELTGPTAEPCVLIQAEWVTSHVSPLTDPVYAKAEAVTPSRRRQLYLVLAGLLVLVIIMAVVTAVLVATGGGDG
jgi:hypothetical protein